MSKQLYYELKNFLNEDFNILSKDQIKNKLVEILDLVQPCPKCKGLHEPISKFGRELDPDARYGAAETLYTLCPNCKYVYHYEF